MTRPQCGYPLADGLSTCGQCGHAVAAPSGSAPTYDDGPSYGSGSYGAPSYGPGSYGAPSYGSASPEQLPVNPAPASNPGARDFSVAPMIQNPALVPGTQLPPGATPYQPGPPAYVLPRGKDKSIALIFALFLGFWTWVYTYRLDATKFWIAFVLVLVSIPLDFVVIGFFIDFGVWVWAVIAVCVRPDQTYRAIP